MLTSYTKTSCWGSMSYLDLFSGFSQKFSLLWFYHFHLILLSQSQRWHVYFHAVYIPVQCRLLTSDLVSHIWSNATLPIFFSLFYYYHPCSGSGWNIRRSDIFHRSSWSSWFYCYLQCIYLAALLLQEVPMDNHSAP